MPRVRRGNMPRGSIKRASSVRTSGLCGRSARRMLLPGGHEYWLYVPPRIALPARVLLAVHGISRNAREQVQLFQPWADKYGLVLIAPLFLDQGSSRYQRLESKEPENRSDRVLQRILDEVEELTGIATARCYFFGFSGGGQFVHRYAMAYPGRVKAAVLGAPGWYTYPDSAVEYPFGLRDARSRLGDSFDPEEFLQIPIAVFVGERDVARDASLNTRPTIDRRQGMNRLDRGRYWIAAMRAEAERRDIASRFEFQVLPRAGHSFLECMEQGGLAEAAFRFLFSAETQGQPSTPSTEVAPASLAACPWI